MGDGARQPDRGRPRDARDLRGPREFKPEPQLEINVSFKPDDKGVDSLARQIKMTGRAYPLFEIAQMVLGKPERHSVTLGVKKNAEGKAIQPLFQCALDDTLWLSEEDAVRYVLDKHFGTFYQVERVAVDPPKGVYTFVGQCGMTGFIFGPPNHHDYQNQLHKLHTERFARMPFEAYKARVRIVRDEAVVKKWIEDQSFKSQFLCLNLPEPLNLGSREAVEKHFRETHLSNIVRAVETVHLTGQASRSLRLPALQRLVRFAWDEQKRFPLQIATVLSQQFASRGLQFFKVNKTVTHVSVARPHFLDIDAAPISEGVKRIVQFINATPKCSHRQLFEALAPAPPAGTPAEGEAAPAPGTMPGPTPEQTAVLADLHWLVHQGHVIEFANGVLETAKKPVLKPEKPKPVVTPAVTASDTAASAGPVEPSIEQLTGQPAAEVGTVTAASEPVVEAAAADLANPPAGS